MAPALILPHLISFPLQIYPILYPSPPAFYTSIFFSSLLLSSSSHLALPSNHYILFLFFFPTRLSMNLLHSLSVLLYYTYSPFLMDLSSFFCFSLFSVSFLLLCSAVHLLCSAMLYTEQLFHQLLVLLLHKPTLNHNTEVHTA